LTALAAALRSPKVAVVTVTSFVRSLRASPSGLAWASFAAISLIWGSTYLGIAVGLRSFTPMGLVAIRFGLAGVACLALGRLRREEPPARAQLRDVLLSGALLLGVCNILVSWAELHVPSGLAAILCALSPIYFGLLTLRSEPLGARGWGGTLLAFAGVIVLSAAEAPGETGDGLPQPLRSAADAATPALSSHALGIGALLLANLVWTVATLYAKRRVTTGGMLTNAGLQMLASSALSVALLALTGGSVTSGALRPEALAAVAYLAVFGSCVAFTAYTYVVRVWPAARAGTYAYLNPPIAVLLGALLIDEPFGARTVAGMLVILAGVGLVNVRGRR
jgi:drug/metabolite transporter (DMT)-like permease